MGRVAVLKIRDTACWAIYEDMNGLSCCRGLHKESISRLIEVISAQDCVCSACFTWSSISLVCAADRQKRARASVMGVAGKPTTTTPIFRSSISRAKALDRAIAKNTVIRPNSLTTVWDCRDENSPIKTVCFARCSAGFLLLNDRKFAWVIGFSVTFQCCRGVLLLFILSNVVETI